MLTMRASRRTTLKLGAFGRANLRDPSVTRRRATGMTMTRSMHRLLAATVGVVMVVALMGNAPAAAATTHSPKVVIVVGPVGELTDRYRAIAKSAAKEAARWTSDVVTVASPDATSVEIDWVSFE